MVHNFNTKTAFNAVKNRQSYNDGDIALIADTKETFSYRNQEWNPMTVEGSSGINVSIYDLNRQAIGQLPKHTIEQLEEDKNKINEFANTTNGTYYMMLNNDVRYFTIFTHSNKEEELKNLGEAAIVCAQDLGTVQSLDVNENSVEIWVKTNTEYETICLYLFPYDAGVVYYG